MKNFKANYKKPNIYNNDDFDGKYKKMQSSFAGKSNVGHIAAGGKSSSAHGKSFHVSGGKVMFSNNNNSSNSFQKGKYEQHIIVQAKAFKSGFDFKSGATLTNVDVGGKSAYHLDYINKQNRNTEEDVFDQVFDNLNENTLIEEVYLETFNKEYDDLRAEDLSIVEKEFTSFKDKNDSYEYKQNDDYSLNQNVNKKAQVEYLKSLRQGGIEASMKINDIDDADISKQFLNRLSQNNLKLFKEIDGDTGTTNLYIQGRKEDLLKQEQSIKDNFKYSIPDDNFDQIKDIKSNVMNTIGDKLSYEDLNKMKKEFEEKGVDATTRLEISPKEQFNHKQLEELASRTMIEFKKLTGKEFNTSFAAHSNTEHNHVHIDLHGSKKDVMLSKEQLQTLKVITAEVALDISPSLKAEQHLEQELKRLEQVKMIQKLQDKYNDDKKVNASERHENLSNLARAINKEVGLTEDEVQKVAQLEKLEGLAKFQENQINKAIDKNTKEKFEKRLEFTKKNLSKAKELVTNDIKDKVNLFNEKFEEAKGSKHFQDLKDDYRNAELKAARHYADSLERNGQKPLAKSVLKSAQGQKFNQFFDDYKSERALRNIFSDQFDSKINLSTDKKKELEKLREEKPNRSSELSKDAIKSKGQTLLTDATVARNSIDQKEDPESYRIEQMKFIDAQLITRNGLEYKSVEGWAEMAKKKGMDAQVADGFVELTKDRADKLVDAGILKKVDEGKFDFVDDKAKEILLDNLGKSIDAVAAKNVEAYKEDKKALKAENENKLVDSMKQDESFKNRDINDVIKTHKEELAPKFRNKL